MGNGIDEQLSSTVEDGFDLARLRLKGQVDKIRRGKLGCGEIERDLGRNPGVGRLIESGGGWLLPEEQWKEMQVLHLIAPSQFGESGQCPGAGDYPIDVPARADPSRRQQREQPEGILVEIYRVP